MFSEKPKLSVTKSHKETLMYVNRLDNLNYEPNAQ